MDNQINLQNDTDIQVGVQKPKFEAEFNPNVDYNNNSHIHVEMGGIPTLAKSNSSSSSSSSSSQKSLKQPLSSFVFYAYCRDLPGGKKIDPYLEIISCPHEIINSKTETINNTQDPMWMSRLGFKFQGLDDVIQFQVKNNNFGKDPIIGKLAISMGSLLNEYKEMNNWGYASFDLVSEEFHSGGTLFIQSAMNQFESISFDASASGLPKMDFFGKADPYFTISIIDKENDEDFLMIYKSENLKGTQNPDFGKQIMELFRFGILGMDCLFIVKLWDKNKGGKDDYIGTTKATSWRKILDDGGVLDAKIYNAAKSGPKAVRGNLKFTNVKTCFE